MTNENLKTLPDYLDEIIDSDLNREEPLESEIENAIAQKMPGYKIYAWDADQYGSVEFAVRLGEDGKKQWRLMKVKFQACSSAVP